MVAADSPSIDVHVLILNPLQRLRNAIGAQLINWVEMGRFLQRQRRFLKRVFEPPDPLSEHSMIDFSSENERLRLMKAPLFENSERSNDLRIISQNLPLFDLHPQLSTA